MTAPVKPTRTFVWSVIWRNPYQPRPEGFPEVMLRVEQERPAGAGAGPCPTEIDECWQEMHDYGYCVSVYMTYIPARTLPIATRLCGLLPPAPSARSTTNTSGAASLTRSATCAPSRC